MDEIDLAIFREMFLDHVFRFGGADPRVSAAEIGARLHLSHTAVSRRLKDWVRAGFFRGYLAFPNPELFRQGFYGVQIGPRSVSAGERAMAALPRLGPVVHTWEQGDGDVLFTFLGPSPEGARQGAKTLRDLGVVKQLPGVYRIALPECPHPLGVTDWRITRAVRSLATVTPSRIARSLGLSPRTARRRIDRLVDGLALLFIPQVDHARAPGVLASIRVDLDGESPSEPLWEILHRIWRVTLPVGPWDRSDLAWDLRVDLPSESRFLMLFVTGSSPTEISNRLSEIESVRGCRAAQAFFPARVRGYPEPFDPFIRAALQVDSLG